jgi:enterochelin esterase family protein
MAKKGPGYCAALAGGASVAASEIESSPRGVQNGAMRFLLPLLALATAALAIDDYQLGPDSQPQNVPRGEVRQATFAQSKIFPGTTRDYWVYVPRQYDAAKPACLMVFFDGLGMAKLDGQYRVPVVFDNLIAKKEMPVTVAVFVNPGTFPDAAGEPAAPGKKPRSNRSFEYDSLGDANARFLLEELVPEATKGLNITKDPAGWAVCGNSSGGIAAFTVAWEKPDAFRKVVSHIGSFTNSQRRSKDHQRQGVKSAKPFRASCLPLAGHPAIRSSGPEIEDDPCGWDGRSADWKGAEFRA